MALRNIRHNGDPVLRKVCREVQEVTPRISQLIEDMKETMEDADGVGLAAPQVGIMKRIAVVNVGEGWHVLINPVLIEAEGAVQDREGCLSVPHRWGVVERPQRVVVDAMDENGKVRRIEAVDFLARAICHEMDHLDGGLFIDKMLYEISEEELERERDEA